MRSTVRRASVCGLVVLAGVVLVASGAMPTALRGHGGAPMPTQSRGHGTQLQQVGDAPAPSNVVRQGFPAAGYDPEDVTKSDTAWEVEWELTHPTNKPYMPPGSALRIKSAKFMWKDRTGRPQWVTVARMLELAEIYVPYDNGTTAFLDIHDMSFYMTPARKEFLGPACVAPGEILQSSNPY